VHLCLSPRPSTLKGSLFEGLQHNLSYIDGQKKLYLIVLKELKSNIPETFGQTLRRTFYSDGAVERALVGRPGSLRLTACLFSQFLKTRSQDWYGGKIRRRVRWKGLGVNPNIPKAQLLACVSSEKK
jgi:hypothetical protein